MQVLGWIMYRYIGFSTNKEVRDVLWIAKGKADAALAVQELTESSAWAWPTKRSLSPRDLP